MEEICKKEPLLVTIHCITYNHEPYIRQCLEGFVMQKTNFRFEAIVHDDMSTDNTAYIIREYAEKYPDIIKPIYETENQYSKHDGSLWKIMNENTHGKFVALCEGDDYWTDPLKLQKQVDFMDEHLECGLVYAKVNIYDQDKKSIIGEWGEEGDFDKMLFNASFIPTLSVLFRKELYSKYLEIVRIDKSWLLGDVPLWLFFMKYSEVKFISNIVGVYRKLSESASHSNDFYIRTNFINSGFNIRRYFAEKYEKEKISKVEKTKILNLLNISFVDNRKLKQKLLSEMYYYKIFDIKLFLLVLFSNNDFCRYIIHKRITKKK